ncbi:MAG: prepilin-type N-terminal cleavage/methylation domain-containing protein [Akkermansiaceae bacterium]|nr:prepilin-type N-terminal cleavage/methylation domain-containing protein [Akkermansiaceae bacterium]
MRNHRGFTLTEMIVVIAIVAALAGISYPVAHSMIAKSRESACIDKLRNLGVALQSSIDDAGGQLPDLKSARSHKNEDVPVLETFLLSYAGSEEAFHCPADRKEFKKTGSSYLWNSTQSGRYLSQLSFFGMSQQLEKIPLITDKESWHPNETNFLYADLSVSRKARFEVGN